MVEFLDVVDCWLGKEDIREKKNANTYFRMKTIILDSNFNFSFFESYGTNYPIMSIFILCLKSQDERYMCKPGLVAETSWSSVIILEEN